MPEILHPREGWLRTVRERLGLSRQAIATQLGVTHAAVRDYETAEVRGAISLATFRRVADALGCDLVVALTPRDPARFDEAADLQVGLASSKANPASHRNTDNDELESHLK